MDLYHVWCDLAPDVRDLEFCADVSAYLEHLRERGLIEGFRVTRRKLGLAPPELGEFHILLETRDLTQLERAFQTVGTRAGEVESLHFAANSKVVNARFGLYRDFPDTHRREGEERF